MSCQLKRKSKAKPYTLPPELSPSTLGHTNSPKRSCILFAKALAQFKNIKVSRLDIQKLLGVDPDTQTEILASNEPRTLHNIPDNGPDPRGRKPGLTRQETRAVGSYLDHPDTTFEDKTEPWPEIVEAAGVDLPTTHHFKYPAAGQYELRPRAIADRMWEDEKVGTFVAQEKNLLEDWQAKDRVVWVDVEEPKRPTNEDWRDVLYCDEFHVSIGPQKTKRIKRRIGRYHKNHPRNIQRKKVTRKNQRDKAKEEDIMKLLNVFVVIGYNYRRMLPYTVPAKNGKMNIDCYLTQILPALKDDLIQGGYTLAQDADSAHKSPRVKAWAEEHGVSLLTLPGKSPDLSIFESTAQHIKNKYLGKRCATVQGAWSWFEKVFYREIDQNMIRGLYDKYLNRFKDLRKAEGQMTHY